MIERLVGTVAFRHSQGIILDVKGVGYGVEMSEAAALRLPQDGTTAATVWIFTHVKEDALRLFGFPTYEERMLFVLLIGVNGVGPKLAMTMMSKLDPATIVQAVLNDEPETLRSVPGVAERSKTIVIDLKKKLAKSELALVFSGMRRGTETAWLTPAKGKAKKLDDKLWADVRSALENLGYREREIVPLQKSWEAEPPARDFEGLLRAALNELSGRRGAAVTESTTTTKPVGKRSPEELF